MHDAEPKPADDELSAPQASQPANGASYNFNQQPITLAITNVVRTGSETVTYSVEVARDTGFTNKVFNP